MQGGGGAVRGRVAKGAHVGFALDTGHRRHPELKRASSISFIRSGQPFLIHPAVFTLLLERQGKQVSSVYHTWDSK